MMRTVSLLSFIVASANAQDIGSCCYSATCLADQHCIAGCGTAALPCSDDSCKNCECCPCCGGDTASCATKAPNTKPFQPAGAECCAKGYSGADCKVPSCDESCGAHGKCSAPNTCTCDSGWGGPLCDHAICNGGKGCGAHGNCSAPNTCTCESCWLAPSCAKPKYTATVKSFTNGNMTVVGAVNLTSSPCAYGAGANAMVSMEGLVMHKIATGAVSYQVFESGSQHFVANGGSDYFKVGQHHVSDPSLPLALTLKDPTASTTSYVLTFNFSMPKKTNTGDFSIVFFGQDQDKYPYDFSVTLDYTLNN